MSAGTAGAVPPLSTVPASSSPSMSLTTTCAPSAARRRLPPPPMPAAPPVITAIRPASNGSLTVCTSCVRGDDGARAELAARELFVCLRGLRERGQLDVDADLPRFRERDHVAQVGNGATLRNEHFALEREAAPTDRDRSASGADDA